MFMLVGLLLLVWFHTSYLSFFLHRQNFWRLTFTPKNANFCQFFANFCQFTLKFAPKYANFCQFSPIFRVKSVKIYTGQKKFTRPPPVAPMTNMRYAPGLNSQRWNYNKCANIWSCTTFICEQSHHTTSLTFTHLKILKITQEEEKR